MNLKTLSSAIALFIGLGLIAFQLNKGSQSEQVTVIPQSAETREFERWQVIAPVSLFKMPGKHNLQNLLVAVAAAKLAGIDKKAIAQAITSFPGVAHRLEYICSNFNCRRTGKRRG